MERPLTIGGIVTTISVAIQGLIPGRRVRKALVGKKRLKTVGGVSRPIYVAIERLIAIGCVAVDGIVKERLVTSCGISAAGDVVKQCSSPRGGVGIAASIVKERVKTSAVLLTAAGRPLPLRVRLPKAPSPSAVVANGYPPSGGGFSAC